MAYVREVPRKAGRAFEVKWRERGVEKQKTFSVKRDAERFAARVESAQATGETTEPLTRRGQTVAQVVEASLAASASRLKPGTLAGYRHLYDSRILPRFGSHRIATVTGQQVEAWLSELIAAGRAPSTVHNHYVALSKVFRYAVRHRLIAHNPCDGVELPKQSAREGFAAVFLTAAQVDALADAVAGYPPLDVLVRFAAYTGLRSAEIAGLRVRDVNLAAGHVEVRQTVKRIGAEWVTGTPKSTRSTRNVPLLDRRLIAALRVLLLAHPHSGDPDALFWPARNNGSRRLDFSRPVDIGGVRRYYLRRATDKLGLAQMRFHDLRHTYASLMLAAGFKPYEVSRWMGHASVATTDGIYGHLYPSDYNDQIDRFERFRTQG